MGQEWTWGMTQLDIALTVHSLVFIQQTTYQKPVMCLSGQRIVVWKAMEKKLHMCPSLFYCTLALELPSTANGFRLQMICKWVHKCLSEKTFVFTLCNVSYRAPVHTVIFYYLSIYINEINFEVTVSAGAQSDLYLLKKLHVYDFFCNLS